MKQIPTAKECALHGVTEELKKMTQDVGIGFHPDTDFNDYISVYTGKRLFFKKTAKVLNARLQECFDLANKYELDVYEIALSVRKFERPSSITRFAK